MKSMIHELTTGIVYTETKSISQYPDTQDDFVPMNNFKIHFLPCDPQETFVKKAGKYQDFFDGIFLSTALAHRIENCPSIIKPEGKIVVEGANYMLDLTREQVAAYQDKVIQLAQSCNLKREDRPHYGELLVYTK
jgi:hypothetical protein